MIQNAEWATLRPCKTFVVKLPEANEFGFSPFPFQASSFDKFTGHHRP